MRNKDGPLSDDQCRHAFALKREAHHQWTRDDSRVSWEEFVHCQVTANEAYSEAKHQFGDRNRAVLMNDLMSCPSISGGPLLSLRCLARVWHCPQLVSEGGGLVCESVGKANLLSDDFDGKQTREAVDLPLTCYPSPTTYALRSREVRHLLLDLDSHGGTDPLQNLAGDRPLSPQFRKFQSPPLLPITDRFPYRQYCLHQSKVFVRRVSVCLGRFIEHMWCASTHPVCLSERSGYL